MSTCIKCGGSLGDPFDFSSTTVSSCQCNLAGLVSTSEALPSNPCCVISVAGKTGEVQLTINDIDLLGNQFFTESAARAIISASAPLAYNPLTGVVSHSASGVPIGTYGSSTEVPVITINEAGHITGVTLQALVYPDLGLELPAIEALSGSGFLVKTAVGTWTFRSISSTSRLTVTYPDGVTGNPVIDLAVSGVTAGTYGSSTSYPVINVDAYGRVTNASSLVIPTPTLPAHTHSLGDLSNVNDEVDTLATVNDVLYWTGTQWSYKSIAAGTVVYDSVTVAPYSGWTVCTGDGDVDTGLMDQPINLVRKLDDTTFANVTYVHYAVYITQAAFVARAAIDIVGTKKYSDDLVIGTLPTYYRPIHTVSFPSTAVLWGRSYWNAGHTTQFGRKQVLDSISIVIKPSGTISMNLAFADATVLWASLGDVDYLIVPVSCSFPSKKFV